MLFWGPHIVFEHEALCASLHVPGSEADSEGIILLQKEVPGFLEESPNIVGISVSSPNRDPREAADGCSCTGSSMLVINQAQFIADVCVLFPTTVSPCGTQAETEVGKRGYLPGSSFSKIWEG